MSNPVTNEKNAAKANCCGTCDCTTCSCGCAKDKCRCQEQDCQCGCRVPAGAR